MSLESRAVIKTTSAMVTLVLLVSSHELWCLCFMVFCPAAGAEH